MKKLLILFSMFLFSLCLYSQTADESEVYKQLKDYVNKGNIKETENIIKKYNVDLNHYYDENYTLLAYAVTNDNMEMTKLLLKYKADVNAPSYEGMSALILSVIYHKNIEMVKLLLSYGADINQKCDLEGNALFYALDYYTKENIEMVKFLIANKADVNILYHGFDGNEETPLMYAAMKGYKETVKILIANKAEVNKRNRNNANALLYAYMFGHKDIVDILLQNGSDSLDKTLESCDLNQRTFLSMSIPLVTAIIHLDDDAFLQKLIDNGADVNCRTFDDNTALMVAASLNEAGAVKVLLKNNADVNLQNRYGITALINACMNGNLEIAKMLLDAGANKRIKTNEKKDALYYAKIKGKNRELIRLLE
ncbi:ankyrin repeat domain-containing protein [Brachyspira hyodysenteriae]|uniref:ankyrin repeat domain-containing protein n=1 Tax=Brachyspira hyodysenteriae TaxID=159 RepID=UPI00063D9CE0|nr:ankyrin repeat domain-containing protein [Brachyspira hyodysenteriae]AUJ48834.1 ankyrin repeat-containing protein [Brachyspira hyodysenteriae]KLI49504.1 ankyrin [Brachyspira hyodysenteriae]WPC24618.1 ankyrin repeat domain-containing protein [Brachyspira hyodysenteriae]